MSNLFMRIFEGHPQLTQRDYFFFKGYFIGPERQCAAARENFSYMPGYDNWQELTYQKALEDCQGFIKSTEEQASFLAFTRSILGKIPLMKDHAHHLLPPAIPFETLPPKPTVTDPKIDSPSSPDNDTPNPSFLPTRFLLTLTPIFIIRHPAHIVASFLRAVSKTDMMAVDNPEFATATAFQPMIQLMDFYRANGIEPIVIDGGRLVNNTKRVISELCEKVGVDESIVKYEWEPRVIPEKFVGTGMDSFAGTAWRSTGVQKERGTEKPVVIEEEVKKWEDEWDVETAKIMEKLVRESMADYEKMLGYAI
ncbi:hypothetical protein VNI00_000663 [Paramarasmius palmivorus]|uniref:Sulfotransferase n=1 Tax=Paramarasmius palmivorus TaxID=297713 RepID=A0AAW0E9D6_9AGAR